MRTSLWMAMVGWMVLVGNAWADDWTVDIDSDEAPSTGSELHVGGHSLFEGTITCNAQIDTTFVVLDPWSGSLPACTTPDMSLVYYDGDANKAFLCENGNSGGAEITTQAKWDTSAEIAANVTDETGTGALCFATSPTLPGRVDMPNQLHVGMSPTPTPSPTATGATPTATGVTPTPTATATPDVDFDVAMVRTHQQLEMVPGSSIYFPNKSRSGRGRLGLESAFGVMELDMSPINVFDLRNNSGVIQWRWRTTHMVSTGVAPASLTAGCGSTASLHSASTDHAGFITIAGSSIGTTCGFTFNTAWTTNRPVCHVQFETNGAATYSDLGVVTTTTTLVASNFNTTTGLAANFTANDVLNYLCFGIE